VVCFGTVFRPSSKLITEHAKVGLVLCSVQKMVSPSFEARSFMSTFQIDTGEMFVNNL
jgi:hypothetical protein